MQQSNSRGGEWRLRNAKVADRRIRRAPLSPANGAKKKALRGNTA
jgi:hypothetical protein